MKEIINKIKNKKKKKGFTLVELLAVIVILAVIMILTIPTVLNNVGEAKKKSFETVGKTLIKYIDDNYQNCKLGNKDIAKYDESLFDPNTCNLKNDIKEGSSKDWISNAGYNKEDISEVKVSINSEGKVDITVKPSDTGEYKDSEKFTTIALNYDPSCWETRPIGTDIYVIGFKGVNEDLTIKEECNGFVEKDSDGEIHLNIPSKIGDSIIYGIGPNAFNNNTLISYVTISEGIDSIMPYAFKSSKLKEVIIPASVTSISMEAFVGVKTLKKIEFKKNSQLRSISDGAFKGVGITSITIPNTVESIGNYAFSSSSITELNFEKDSRLKKISNFAFQYTKITSITIPNSVESIGENAFSDSSLTKLDFESDSKLTTIEESAFSGNNINSVEIPESVVTIGASAFSGVYSVYFCNDPMVSTNLKTIGSNAFRSVIQKNIIIPKSVETIGSGAFYFSDEKNIKFCGTLTAGNTDWYNSSTTQVVCKE